jgi:hypothetical protein
MKQNETNLGEKGEKGETKFHCILCDYTCSIKFSYDRHILTAKHVKRSQNETNETNETKKEKKREKGENNKNVIICDCGSIYHSRTTLWRHKKICNEIKIPTELLENNNNNDNKNDLINYLIKENQEFKNLILEIVKKDTYNNCNNPITNSHNKAFNLNFFLNETCKDAMNITDFVESIKLQLTDLERVGEVGYVEGISNIIVKNLKELDVTQRPVHCTDKKRETMYVKDENAWEKDEEKKKMHKLVKKVADKNMRLLPEYREKHPDYIKASSIVSDKYNQIFLESLGGSGDNNFEKEEKIIQKVSREVFVQKSL